MRASMGGDTTAERNPCSTRPNSASPPKHSTRIDRRALPEAKTSMAVDGRRYTCRAALADEIEKIFRRQPLPVAFGCEVAEPGDYLTLDIAGVPVMLIRDDEDRVRGLLNTCRHRGARLLDGAGQVGKSLVCPYHNWTYDRCGMLTAQPGAEYFPECRRRRGVPGCASPRRSATASSGCCSTPPVRSISDEALGDFGSRACGLRAGRTTAHRGSHVWTKRMNWKLGVDTFLEYYHVPILHRASIGKDAVRHGLPLRGLRPAFAPGGAPPQHHGAAGRRPGDVARGAARDHRLPPLPQCGVR